MATRETAYDFVKYHLTPLSVLMTAEIIFDIRPLVSKYFSYKMINQLCSPLDILAELRVYFCNLHFWPRYSRKLFPTLWNLNQFRKEDAFNSWVDRHDKPLSRYLPNRVHRLKWVIYKRNVCTETLVRFDLKTTGLTLDNVSAKKCFGNLKFTLNFTELSRCISEFHLLR